MLRKPFNKKISREKAAAELAELERSARRDLLDRIYSDDMPKTGLRGDVFAALKNRVGGHEVGKAFFSFFAEPALPVAKKHLAEGFSELLLRMSDRGGKQISPYGVIHQINQANVHPGEIATSTEPYAGWSAWFRRWLAIAQIDSIKGQEGRFSINVSPQDFAMTDVNERDSQNWADYGLPDFPADLRFATELCRRTGTPPLRFEATEDRHWQYGRAEKLVEVVLATDAVVMVDDYGAEHQSINFVRRLPQTAATVQTFAELLPASRLRVKMDGGIVKFCSAELEGHLQDIRQLAPDTGVILEWVESAANTKALLKGLSAPSREMVVAAQDRSFDRLKPEQFIAQVDADRSEAPGIDFMPDKS